MGRDMGLHNARNKLSLGAAMSQHQLTAADFRHADGLKHVKHAQTLTIVHLQRPYPMKGHRFFLVIC